MDKIEFTYFICGVFCTLLLVLAHCLRPAKFKIVPYYDEYKVYYLGRAWFKDFKSVAIASVAIIIFCGDAGIKNYQIISPTGNDISPNGPNSI